MELLTFLENYWHVISGMGVIIMMGVSFWFKHMVWKPIQDNKKNLEKQNQNYNEKFDVTHAKIDGLREDIKEVSESTSKNQGMLETLIELSK